jgi:hypothetical protein
MKKFLRLFILFIIPVSFLSCETDFDVIADYKEVAIVYGLLNQNDTIHYLRINKAFLGEGNALTYAQVADSSSFGADIKVVLTETTPGGSKRDIVFDTVTLHSKEPGDFYSPDQLFYFSKAKLSENNTYALTITNKKTSYVATSQTLMIHNFEITQPLYRPPPLPPVTLSFRRASTSVQRFAWKNAVNGKRYQFRLYFSYNEIGAKGDTTHCKVEWVFPVVNSETTTGTGESFVNYYNEDFFVLCETKIPYSEQAKEDAVLKRIASVCDLEVTAVGDEFTTYLDANAPSTGLLIEKPNYTNITNGVGLFSCRYQIHRLMNLSPETILDLSTTTDLKFVKPSK